MCSRCSWSTFQPTYLPHTGIEYVQVKAPPVRPLLTLPLLAPAICKAEAGELGGVVDLAFYLLIFFVVWALLTGAFSWLLRKQPPGKRGGLTLLFFSLPVLVLFGWGALDQFLGTRETTSTERPIAPSSWPVCHFRWKRSAIRADRRRILEPPAYRRTVRHGCENGRAGNQGASRQDFDVDVWSVTLTRPQTIDGWSCAPDSVVMRWQPDVTQRQLYQCGAPADDRPNRLARRYPCQPQQRWQLDAVGSASIMARRLPRTDRHWRMRATYGPALDLKTWSANFADSDTVIGDYLFSSDTTDATGSPATTSASREKAETRKPAKRSTACCYNLRNIGRASGTPADSKRAAAATRTLADMI